MRMRMTAVLIAALLLTGCGDSYMCYHYNREVTRLELCVRSDDCTFTASEFYDYRVTKMRQKSACLAAGYASLRDLERERTQ